QQHNAFVVRRGADFDSGCGGSLRMLCGQRLDEDRRGGADVFVAQCRAAARGEKHENGYNDKEKESAHSEMERLQMGCCAGCSALPIIMKRCTKETPNYEFAA